MFCRTRIFAVFVGKTEHFIKSRENLWKSAYIGEIFIIATSQNWVG